MAKAATPPSGRSPRAFEQRPPGMRAEYNHDLNVSDAFLNSYGAIQAVLRDGRLCQEFKFYDSQAKLHKRWFHLLGMGSLLLGLLTLTAAAMSVIAGRSTVQSVNWVWIIAEGGSVAAIVLTLWNRLRRHRVLWCQAVFCRERLRQWHFQLFLDGQFIGQLSRTPAQFRAEADRRWGILQQNLRDGYGMMTAFMRQGSGSGDLMHEVSCYEDPLLAKLVLEALWTLRFEHQLRFGQRKVQPEPEQAGMALEERTGVSNAVATFTLAGAVLVGAVGFFIAIAEHVPAFHPVSWDAETINSAGRWTAGVALLLAVWSAATRTFRAGFTLPGESESYEEYCDRIRELKAVFETATTEQDRFRALQTLESEAASELRRFLKMKMRATFVF